ncbi:MAG: cysteine desulfurase family protein [Candidatus Nomurabacteria bacterium]|nr:cysteine desulfurase family protein [Candidatus Nomurabacteria bacterium]
MFRKRKIYLDYASMTPVDKKVVNLVHEVSKKATDNPNAIHSGGVFARSIVEDARKSVAKSINAQSDEIFFLGSGTESDALAILGVVRNLNKKDFLPHIVTTNIEHSAVLENCRLLEERSEAEVTYVNVEENGIVDPKKIREAIKGNTVLVSVMYANNEIGTIQPIREIAKEIRHYKKHNGNMHELFALYPQAGSDATHNSCIFPLLHTDAAQAMNYLDTDNVDRLGVDMMSFNSTKIYGPKGVAVLYKKRGIELSPLYAGGGQEGGLRSGTENVAAIAGMALALKNTNRIKDIEYSRLTKLRDYAIGEILRLSEKSGYKIILNGDIENRLPNNINITVEGISSELLVIELDAKGVAVSERSACSADSDDGSHVIRAIRNVDEKNLQNSLKISPALPASGLRHGSKFSNNFSDLDSVRITLGRETKKSDLDYLISTLENILNKYKSWK